MSLNYEKIFYLSDWVNKHVSKTTPIGASRLNVINHAIDTLDDRTVALGNMLDGNIDEWRVQSLITDTIHVPSDSGELNVNKKITAPEFEDEEGNTLGDLAVEVEELLGSAMLIHMSFTGNTLYYNGEVVTPAVLEQFTGDDDKYIVMADKDGIKYFLSYADNQAHKFEFSAVYRDATTTGVQISTISMWASGSGSSFNMRRGKTYEAASVADLNATKESLSDIRSEVDVIWKLQQGQTSDTLTQTTYAKSITVPQASVSDDVQMIGGMSIKTTDDEGQPILIDGKVSGVVSTKNGTELSNVTIPTSLINACPDYGIGVNNTCYNYVDWVAKKYHHKVDTRAYQSGDESDTSVLTDGTTTYYALATEEVIDISSYITDELERSLMYLDVEAGGTLSFVYTDSDKYDVDIPSTNAWAVKHASGDSYSTDEQIIGKWIDGKPLYRKVFVLTGTYILFQNSWGEISEIDVSNVKDIICGKYLNNAGTLYSVDTTRNKTNNLNIIYLRNTATLTISPGSYIILEYTKSTSDDY